MLRQQQDRRRCASSHERARASARLSLPAVEIAFPRRRRRRRQRAPVPPPPGDCRVPMTYSPAGGSHHCRLSFHRPQVPTFLFTPADDDKRAHALGTATKPHAAMRYRQAISFSQRAGGESLMRRDFRPGRAAPARRYTYDDTAISLARHERPQCRPLGAMRA